MTREQRELAETIAKANGGCVAFNITKSAQIAGRSRNGFPAWLHKHGVMAEQTGKDKLINVNDLAVAILEDRESPL